MKKILFGITSLTLGGAERVLVDLANALCDKYEITQEDICNLSCTNQRYDVGLIDAFPGVDTSGYETFLKKICKEIYII